MVHFIINWVLAMSVGALLAVVTYSLVRKRMVSNDKNALLAWVGGDERSKIGAVKFLNTLGTATLARYLAMIVENPKTWEFEQDFHEDLSNFSDYQAVFVDTTTGHTVTFWYDMSRAMRTSWSKNNKTTGSLLLPYGSVVMACTKLDAQGVHTIKHTETIEADNKNIDIIKHLLKESAGKSTSDVIDPAHKKVLSLLIRHPEDAVMYLDDPVLKDEAKKIMEGT